MSGNSQKGKSASFLEKIASKINVTQRNGQLVSKDPYELASDKQHYSHPLKPRNLPPMARKWKENQNQRGVGAIVGSGATVSRPVVVCKVKKRKVKVKVRRSTSRTSQENQTRQSATPVQMPPALVKPAIQIAEEIPELDEIPCIEYPPSTYCHLTNVVHTTASEERHSSTQACGDLTSISRQTPSQQKSSRDEQIKTMSTRIHDPVEEKPRTIKPASPTKIPRHVPEPQAEPKIRDIVSDILHPGIVWDLHTLAKGSNALSLLFQNFNPNCFVSQADRPVDLPDHVYEKYDLRRPNVVAIPRSQTEIANPLTHTYKTFRNDFSNRSLAVPPFVASFSPNSPPSLPLQYQTCPMPIPYQPIRDTAVFADAPKDSYLLLSPPHIALLKKQYSEPTIRDLEQERSSTNDEERGSSGRQLSSSASNRYQTQRNCYSVLSKAGSLLRNASNGGGKMAMEIKLGGLGPDKDNDAYKTGLEKMNRQKEYAEKVRRQLADQASRPRLFSRERIRADSASSSVRDHETNKVAKLPSIVVALPKDPRAEAIAKREKMRQYAESIKKPAISQTGAPSTTKLPRINIDQAHSMSDLVRLQKAHMSSMKDIDSIRRQLNL